MALAACGVGCDHLEGEELVAVLDDSKQTGVFVGAVITSRRYAWRNMTDRGGVRWADLSHVTIDRSPLATSVRCFVIGGEVVRVPPTTANVGALFEAVLQLSGVDRAMSIRPLPHGRTAAQEMVLERAQSSGRGQHFGSWLSPAPPTDLARALAILLGPPVSAGTHGDHHVCDFALSPSWQRIAHVEAPQPQLEMLHRAGYAHPMHGVRVVTKPLWPGSTFTLHGLQPHAPAVPLEDKHPALLAHIFAELGRVEERLFQAMPPERASAPARA